MSHQAAVAVAALLLTGGATAIIICITVLAGRPLARSWSVVGAIAASAFVMSGGLVMLLA
jgi:hypothetical protein